MDLIEGAYSENSEFANRIFKLLINYFGIGFTADKEINFLVSNNNN